MKKYVHDYRVDQAFNNKNGIRTGDIRVKDGYLCYFWDVDMVFPEKMQSYIRSESYCPVSVMKLETLPSIGDYIQVMKKYKDDRDLYRIVSKCLSVEITIDHVIYDFEVERVEEGNQKAIL